MFDKIDQLGVNTIRTLSIDAIQKANSGHPGLPMGVAPMAYVLWTKHLKVNPVTHMNWINRDRFILSAGHGSAMLYSLLHLSGYDVSLADLKQFRQLGSKTPGHPEYGVTDGVEATTGPLGQGMAMAVGMAMAEAHLRAKYNRPNYPVIDHYTYTIVGDGDLMEGVSQEAASLAGHLKLNKLIVLYDSNGISLDGSTKMAFTENIRKKFDAYGWNTLEVKNGNDLEEIDKAITQAKKFQDKPTLIEVKTTIGFGAKDEGTHLVHGAPLGEDGVKFAKKAYGWNYPAFTVPDEVKKRFTDTIWHHGINVETNWNAMFSEYKKRYPQLARRLLNGFTHVLPEKLQKRLPVYKENDAIATRNASHAVIERLSGRMAELWGGAADLASSNKTMVKASGDFTPENYAGDNIWFGVREFAMAAAMNGIMLHGGTRVYGGTFFVFSDYLKAAIRLSAMQHLPVVYVLTHDSIAVGEDGPTHEPIEHLAGLRAIPNVQVIRPADGNETSAAWEVALKTTDKPTILVLSRQSLKSLPVETELQFEGVEKGGYIVRDSEKDIPDGIIIATGSEVNLALQAQDELLDHGQDVRVVSLPSIERFKAQSDAYQSEVIPKNIKNRITLEAASTFGWAEFAGDLGATIGIDHFGESGPGAKVMDKLGMNVDNVVNTYLELGTARKIKH